LVDELAQQRRQAGRRIARRPRRSSKTPAFGVGVPGLVEGIQRAEDGAGALLDQIDPRQIPAGIAQGEAMSAPV